MTDRNEDAPVATMAAALVTAIRMVSALTDSVITDRQLAGMGADIEAAGRVIDGLRARRAEMVR